MENKYILNYKNHYINNNALHKKIPFYRYIKWDSLNFKLNQLL